MNKKKKSVKERIFISNTYMVLVILSLFLLVNIVVIKLYEMSYKDKLINATELANHAEKIKNILEKWELSSNEEVIEKLVNQLNPYEAFVSVQVDEKIIYSNAELSVELFEKELGQFLKEDENLHIYVKNHVTLLTKYDKTKKIRVYVFTGDNQKFWTQKNGYSNLLLVILFDGIFFIGVLLIVSRIFTKKLIKHILEPLNALSEGAKRMKAGNLSEQINYKGDIEFENVCNVFNQMQTYTKEINEEKETYEKARIDMIAGISHDLRTPLTAIRGTIKGIQDGIAATPEIKEKFLDIAYRRTIDMDHLLERLFYFSKLETGNMPLIFEVTRWDKYLETYVKSYKKLEENKSIELNLVKVPKEIFLNIDKQQFKRILDNLIENSKKYSKRKNIIIEINTIIEGSYAIIEVSDNGIGVSENVISRLFEQFYQGDESRHQRKGNGLGLYIVKYLIEQMGGNVTAENRNGFTIRMKLPTIQEGVN